MGKRKKPRKSTQDEKVEREGEEDERLNRVGEGPSKPVKARTVWTMENEIVVLQGIIDFAIDKGKSCFGVEHNILFHEFVKRSLTPLPPTPYQLSEKIRSLKKKCITTGNSFFKAHDLECLQLCRRIWQADGKRFETSAISPNHPEKKSESDSLGDWFHHSFLLPSLAGLGLDQDRYKRGWCMVPEKEKKELADKYLLLEKQGSEVIIQKSQFLHEIVSLIVTGSR